VRDAALLHKLPIDTIDQRTIADRLIGIERASGAVPANRARAAMSAMFTWAMKEGLALANPVINTNKRVEKARDRALNYAELRAVWNALEDDQYGTIVKLLMLTGQRLNEIAGLCRSEVDFDRNLISLPGTRTKNGRSHDVPMSPTVRALLKAQPQRVGRDLIFGKREGPFSGFSRCKAELDKRITEMTGSALAPWVVHDLRRSVATRMAERGVLPHVIEALLNHVSGHKSGVAGIYNLSTYEKEKAQAVALWDEHLLAAVKVTA
jgi:integrase